jgi:hypothetical protein
MLLYLISAPKQGKSPKTTNKIMPGIKKLGKGAFRKIDKGNPPSSLPEGEIIKDPPPPTALNPRKHNKQSRILRGIWGFITIDLKFCKLCRKL